jgi:Tfp pilus assembly protein PilX
MSSGKTKNSKESGASLIIALLVMSLLIGFAALALARAISETAITSNDTVESRTFGAAEAALEDATRDFATVVENKLIPTTTDINTITNKAVPYFATNGYSFTKVITQISASKTVTQTKGQFQGLVSMRDEWQIDVTAKDTATGVETQVRRRFFNDRIPIFQFGAFYQDDLEVNDPPLFIFNGRVHTNGNFFVNSNGNDIRFKSKITVAGEIIRDRWKTGAALTSSEQSNNVYAPNGTYVDTLFPENRGSVTCSAGTGGILTDITGRNFPYPNCVSNPNWSTFSTGFEGNVVTKARKLSLPVYRLNIPLIEMVRRSKNIGDMANIGGTIQNVAADDEDNGTVSRERFTNKEGLRISLADSKAKLPQCANVSGACGVRLDGTLGSSLGYQPLTMLDGYVGTALNGNRIGVSGREVWIKIELVDFDYDNQNPITKDVTQDILSLGVTEPVIDSTVPNLQVSGYTANTDSRSIIKLQRFTIEGTTIPNPGTTSYITNQAINSKNFNFAVRFKNAPVNGQTVCAVSPGSCTADDAFSAPVSNSAGGAAISTDETAHYKLASFDGGATRSVVVPFPIQLFDTREGNRADSSTGVTTGTVFKNGVMSLVDIDVDNLRRFLGGEFDATLPNTTPYALSNGSVGLKSTNVPQNRGWVVYFSDRRGDYNFDGAYDMEDVNPYTNSNIDEDLDNNGAIDTDYTNEAPTQDSEIEAGRASVTDHKFFRRGVRLINGTNLPGTYDAAVNTNTKGFTFASENGIYVQGNYNVQSVAVAGGTSSTTSDKYLPLDTAQHIPASIVGDAVTVLSGAWNDSKSFYSPYNQGNRIASDTQVRFAMLAGDPITGYTPSAGISGNQNGGLINFKRFLESWSNKRLNYSGSLINLFNSFGSNGRHKCCNVVYNPPIRDWTFENSFTEPTRLPPGTPFVYFMTFTGFERVNE